MLVTFLTLVNFYTSLTLIPLYVLELGGDSFFSGLQNTLFFLSGVILRFYFGPLGDAKGRRLPFLLGVFVFATSPLLFWLCRDVFQLVLVRLYQAIGLAAFFSTGNTLAADFAAPGKTGLYIGANRMMYPLALLVGPWLGRMVVAGWGYGPWFLVSAAIGAVALSLALAVKVPAVPCKPAQNFLAMIWEAMQVKTLWPILGHVLVVSGAYGVLLTFLPVYLELEAGMANSGLYFTCFGLAGIGTNLLFGYLSDRRGRQGLVVPALVSMAVGFGLLYWVRTSVGLVFLSAACCGLAYAGGMAVLAAWLVDVAGAKRRATVLALYDNCIDVAVAAGSFLVGILSQGLALQWIFPLIGVMIFAYLTAVWFQTHLSQ